jgi:two-component system, NtrC family, C4-dicarboxylate transport sensor histidine kinase DctB
LWIYISKIIIERNMGGELSVYNDEEGAVFKIVVAG